MVAMGGGKDFTHAIPIGRDLFVEGCMYIWTQIYQRLVALKKVGQYRVWYRDGMKCAAFAVQLSLVRSWLFAEAL